MILRCLLSDKLASGCGCLRALDAKKLIHNVVFTHLESNLMTLMRGARARWKIENETFNTLKNQGYHFEHNFGHGNQHLATVLMHLMMLAFLIDQIQQRCCRLFQAAWTAQAAKRVCGASCAAASSCA
jgi:hypothetical protein